MLSTFVTIIEVWYYIRNAVFIITTHLKNSSSSCSAVNKSLGGKGTVTVLFTLSCQWIPWVFSYRVAFLFGISAECCSDLLEVFFAWSLVWVDLFFPCLLGYMTYVLVPAFKKVIANFTITSKWRMYFHMAAFFALLGDDHYRHTFTVQKALCL